MLVLQGGVSAEAEAVPEAIQAAGRETLEIVFLGTGAAIPAKYRNVTGIYLHMFARGGMMLDCGAPQHHSGLEQSSSFASNNCI